MGMEDWGYMAMIIGQHGLEKKKRRGAVPSLHRKRTSQMTGPKPLTSCVVELGDVRTRSRCQPFSDCNLFFLAGLWTLDPLPSYSVFPTRSSSVSQR